MKESVKSNEKRSINAAHIWGFINEANVTKLEDGKSAINMKVATYESFEKDGKKERRYTNHDVRLVTKNEETVKSFEAIAKDIEANKANKDNKEYKIVAHTISLDGHLRQNNFPGEDGNMVYSYRITTDDANIKLDTKRGENESMNSIEVKGNIAKINVFEKSAIIDVATHYIAPGFLNDNEGKPLGFQFEKDGRKLTQIPTFIQTRINENRLPEVFAQIKNGELAVGDLIRTKGQMHEPTKDGNRLAGIIIDVAPKTFNLVAKKAENKEQAVEQKAEPAKKAAAAKKPAKKAEAKKGRTL